MTLAQPALTRSLGELERELGAPLFERRSRGVVATAVGRAFVRRAISIPQEVRRTREEVEQLRGLGTGTVTAGVSIAAHLALLPSALRPFRARYPQVRLHIIEGFYPTLESGLRDGTIDFYVGPDPGVRPIPELSREVLFKNRRVVLCRAGHPLAFAASLKDLQDADWVTTSITADAEDEMGTLFRSHGLPPPRLAVRSQSALSLITCLSHSDLLAMAPVQWEEFALTRAPLSTITVKEVLAASSLGVDIVSNISGELLVQMRLNLQVHRAVDHWAHFNRVTAPASAYCSINSLLRQAMQARLPSAGAPKCH